MDKNLCNTCEYRKKLKFTTLFECTKYDKVLEGKPPRRCQECMKDKVNKPKEKTVGKANKNKKKEFIEVK